MKQIELFFEEIEDCAYGAMNQWSVVVPRSSYYKVETGLTKAAADFLAARLNPAINEANAAILRAEAKRAEAAMNVDEPRIETEVVP